jgi:hypothetical protein
MGLGRLANAFIDIITAEPTRDAEGFATQGDTVLASCRAYKEDRNGSLKWANRAAFSTATALFRFRRFPGLEVKPSMYISCGDGRYRIVSVEDLYGKGMYLNCLVEKADA